MSDLDLPEKTLNTASTSATVRSPASLLRDITPALHAHSGQKRRIFLDAPSGTQMPQPVLDAMTSYLRSGMANRGGLFPTSLATEATLVRAREMVTALLGAPGYHIVFGQNMTALSFAAATSIARDWSNGHGTSRIVVSELDHHANIDPWRSVAHDKGIETAWLPVDPRAHALDLSSLEELVDRNCRLVAVGLSSNAVGTVSDVARITRRAREVGAISVIDAVHGLSHIPIDVSTWQADVVFFSAYKMFGPHIGVMAIRSELLDRVKYYKLAPAANAGPAKAEHGTQNMEALAGLCASLDLIASFGDHRAPLRHRLTEAIAAFARHEDVLSSLFLAGLKNIPGVKLARAPAPVPTTSTIAFTIRGRTSGDIAALCARDGVYITSGDFYATTLADRTGVAGQGGWLRAGLAAYHDRSDVTAALESIERAARTTS